MGKTNAVLEPGKISKERGEIAGIVAEVPSRRRVLLPGSEGSIVGGRWSEGVRDRRICGVVTTDHEGGRNGYEESREREHCSR